MKRDTMINVLLIIAGIMLAIALFGAGAFWRGKATPTRSTELLFKPGRKDFQLDTVRPLSHNSAITEQGARVTRAAPYALWIETDSPLFHLDVKHESGP